MKPIWFAASRREADVLVDDDKLTPGGLIETLVAPAIQRRNAPSGVARAALLVQTVVRCQRATLSPPSIASSARPPGRQCLPSRGRSESAVLHGSRRLSIRAQPDRRAVPADRPRLTVRSGSIS
jgi:hypothetical protein